MATNKDEARERTPSRRSTKQTIAEALVGRVQAPPARPFGPSYPRESFGDLRDLMDSGYFRSVVYKPDDHGGVTFTLKAVLEVRSSPIGVYMHGHASSVEMAASVIDDLLRKGVWRVDKYARPSPRDR